MNKTFESHEGKMNSPTWDVFTFLMNEDVTRQRLEELMLQTADEQKQVKALKAWFFTQKDVYFLKGNLGSRHREAFALLFGHWVTDPQRHIDWFLILDTLQGKAFLSQDESLEETAVKVLQQVDWQGILERSQEGADTALSSWCTNQCLVWVDNAESRRHPGPFAALPQALLSHYSEAVNWQEVVHALQGE